MSKLKSLITTLGLGAGLMYFYDPDRGRRRRALVRDRFEHLKSQSDDFIEKAAADLRNRAQGVLAEASASLSDQEAPDWIVEQRARARLGRLSRYPGAVQVGVQDGQVIVSGPVYAGEVDRLLAGLGSVRGVRGLENRLDVRQDESELAGLQAGRAGYAANGHQSWSPSTRLLAGIGGGALAIYGRARRGLVGSLFSMAGMSLLARSVANLDLQRLLQTDKYRAAGRM